MSAYGTKVVAFLDTASIFGTTIKAMRESMVTRGLLTTNGLNVPTVAPASPNDGDIYFDKVALRLKIWVDDGTSAQWVQL